MIFLHEGKVHFFGTWDAFESSDDAFIQHFRMEDELIPALDMTE